LWQAYRTALKTRNKLLAGFYEVLDDRDRARDRTQQAEEEANRLV
jgi:hypothetical protein